MNKKLLTIEVFQRSDKKTANGIPEDLAIQIGGLELTLNIKNLTAFVDGESHDGQREYLLANLDAGEQLIRSISRIARLSEAHDD